MMGWCSMTLFVVLGVVMAVVGVAEVTDSQVWWKSATLYQVYPRSFKDSDGNGVGDLKGITQMAPYFKEIGVDAVWLSPIYTSPMADFGYDISNFMDIDPTFGTMQDFDNLVARFRELGIKILLDFVPNHSSNEHPWFKKSIQNDPDYADFYVWVNPKYNGTTRIPPNNWISAFAGSAWTWNDQRGQYYLHQFAYQQPDLNYRNKAVQGNMTAVINFWLDRGVDGLRMDAVQHMFEDKNFPDEPRVNGSDPESYYSLDHIYTMNQPETYTILRQWADLVYQRVQKDGRQRYLASGNTLTDMQYSYRIGVSTLSNIVQCVCANVWDSFRGIYLPTLSEQDWEQVAREFKTKANFPLCLGAIDGKHIRIQNFPHASSMYFNYKKFYSIVLLAVADADYKFLFVDAGAFGKDCDSSVFRQTEFWKKLSCGKLNLPKAKSLPPVGLKVPYVFVADSAFAIDEHILKEFSNHNMSTKQRIFNYRLHRARRFVECAFGILSNKWRIFHRSLNVSKAFSMDIVKACVVLHNMIRTREGIREDDEMIAAGSQLRDLPVATRSTGKTGRGVRTNFANYFISEEGKLPWQLSKI